MTPMAFWLILSLCMYSSEAVYMSSEIPTEKILTSHTVLKRDISADEENNHYIMQDILSLPVENRKNKKKKIIYDDLSEQLKNQMIDKKDARKIKKLKLLTKSNEFQNLQKNYDKNKSNVKVLHDNVKQIISVALNIPLDEINLHDLNSLLTKWNILSRQKVTPNKENNDEYYRKTIKRHYVDPTSVTMPLEMTNLKEDKLKKQRRSFFINPDYMFELTI
ncbi:hypothetical protein, conserved [Plasmodium gonderi]|uniref:Uncharacterized protein n=1 Tax=Plasmodium gonderi TaxID=77519 RepID=A0A1Y1JJK6_PLAGO|nr:hypothetical protein, conserved [Plasmodium gonderi]GAW80643.1 hypothetical protein, conserved [Plasmodium gonderi]